MRRAALALAGVAGAAVLGATAWYRHAPPKPAAPAPPAVPVITATVTRRDMPITLDGLGRVQAFNTVSVKPLVTGQIEQIAFVEGQAVKPGDLLVQIDPRIYRANLQEAQAALARDKAHLENAGTNLNRDTPLARQGFATERELDTQQARVAQLDAMIQSDQAAVDRAQVELGYTKITAPIPGVTGLRLIDVGNVVHPADPGPLVVITQVQPIAVLFTLAQNDLPAVQQAKTHAADGLPVEAWTQDGAQLLGRGGLAVISNEVDAASGTVTLKGEFANADRALWPGQAVQARLAVRIEPNVPTIPAAALQRGADGIFVWVVGTDGTVSSRAVVAGPVQHGTAIVTSGLGGGEQVVSDGQYGLVAGTHVIVQSGAAAQAMARSIDPGKLGISP